jgi:glutaryl-CoA dehydrogenase (non-decarboxylating)
MRAALREYAEQEIAPLTLQYNREHRLPWDQIRELGRMGYMGLGIPEEYGGLGLDFKTIAGLLEEMARIDHLVALLMGQPSCSVGASILRFGTEEQRRKYLPPLARGEQMSAAAFTESKTGSDLAALETRYRRVGDEFILSGTKLFITLCDHADFFLTFATRDKSQGYRGISAFIVERNFPGFSSKGFDGMMGCDAVESGYLFLDDCRVPAANLLGKEGEGFIVAMSGLDRGRLSVATRCVGMAQYCLERSIDYAKMREVSGQAIGRYQLIQQKITEMAIGIESARHFVNVLAECLDKNVHRPTYYSSMAKLQASRVAHMAADHAVQIHGGYGYTTEYQVERYFRDSRMYIIGEGTNEIHQTLIAEALLGYRDVGWLAPVA